MKLGGNVEPLIAQHQFSDMTLELKSIAPFDDFDETRCVLFAKDPSSNVELPMNYYGNEHDQTTLSQFLNQENQEELDQKQQIARYLATTESSSLFGIIIALILLDKRLIAHIDQFEQLTQCSHLTTANTLLEKMDLPPAPIEKKSLFGDLDFGLDVHITLRQHLAQYILSQLSSGSKSGVKTLFNA